MFSEEEVLRRFPNSAALLETADAVFEHLEYVARRAAADRACKLVDFSKAFERAPRRSEQSESANNPAGDAPDESDADLADMDEPELPAEADAESITEPSTPAIDLYDPNEAREQLNGHLPQAENALESLLQIMATPGFEKRSLVVAEPGMSQACCALMAEFPNLSTAAELIAGAVSLAERHHLPIQLPRLLLDGPPGCGKTQLLRRVADILKLPLVVISMAAIHGDFELVGCSRVYRGAEPGRLIKSLLTLKIGNPIFLFDEAELGHWRHYGALLSFLEDNWFTDNFFEMPFCTEHVNKAFITNDADQLSPAIRSRLYRIDVRQPTADEMRFILQRLYTNLRSANPLFVGFPEALDPELSEVLLGEPLRDARKLLEASLYRAACRQVDASDLQLSMRDLVPKSNRPHYQFAPGHA